MDKRTYPDKASKNIKALNKKELTAEQKSLDAQEVAQPADLAQKTKKQEKRAQKVQKDSALQKDSQTLEESSAPKPKRVPESKQEPKQETKQTPKQEKSQATQALATESSAPTKEAKTPAMQKNADLPQDKETSLVQDSKNPLQEVKSTQKQKSTQTSATKESTQDSKNTKTQTAQNEKPNEKPKKAQENVNTTQPPSQKSTDSSTNSAQAINEETEQIQMDSQISQKEALLANILESSENKAPLANKELAKSKEQTPKPKKAQNDESKESHKTSEPKTQDSKQGGNPKQGSQQQNAQTTQSVQNEFEQVQDSSNKEFLESLLELQSTEEGKSTKPSIKEKTATKESSAQTTQNAQNMQPTRAHTITPFAYRTALARESVRNFASNLYQEIQNYKPPLTKITLELNPQNLGTLEVSISKKGKDLHVQVHSNQQAIALFMQNQTDLRTNLAQIGFENVDLSFSQSGGENARQGQNERNQDSNLARNENGLENDDTSANMPNTMHLRIPRYA